jgi:hypothetical protein
MSHGLRSCAAGVLPGDFVALASPTRLTLSKVQAAAALTINWQLACEGRAHPAEEVLLEYGSSAEVERALERARALPEGGGCIAEYSPQRDEVRVGTLSASLARGRAAFSAGRAEEGGWYVVAVGSRATCEREATRLRRIRAGHRSQDGRLV